MTHPNVVEAKRFKGRAKPKRIHSKYLLFQRIWGIKCAVTTPTMSQKGQQLTSAFSDYADCSLLDLHPWPSGNRVVPKPFLFMSLGQIYSLWSSDLSPACTVISITTHNIGLPHACSRRANSSSSFTSVWATTGPSWLVSNSWSWEPCVFQNGITPSHTVHMSSALSATVVGLCSCLVFGSLVFCTVACQKVCCQYRGSTTMTITKKRCMERYSAMSLPQMFHSFG